MSFIRWVNALTKIDTISKKQNRIVETSKII